jgi:hypothetical protein
MRDGFGFSGYNRDVEVSRQSKSEVTMGRSCLVCFRERPNERFGGKGYGARVCKECRKLPKSEQKRILAEKEIVRFLDQKNISAKNIGRLEDLVSIADPGFQALRRLILEIARIAPLKRKRSIILRSKSPLIYCRAVDALLVDEVELWFDDFEARERQNFITDIELEWLNEDLRQHSSNAPPLEILSIDDYQMIATVNRLLREAAALDCEP